MKTPSARGSTCAAFWPNIGAGPGEPDLKKERDTGNAPAPGVMEGKMTLNEYQRLAARTIAPEMDVMDCVQHGLHGMVSEIGELHALYQKDYQGHKFDPEHAKKEVGDLLWFIAEYSGAMGWTLEDVAQTNIDKLKARFPDGFDPERSLHRAKGDI